MQIKLHDPSTLKIEKVTPIKNIQYDGSLVSRSAPGFIIQINKEIIVLNKLIEKYNQSKNTEVKMNVLHQIKEYIQKIQDSYPANVVTLLFDFQDQFQEQLPTIIYQHTKILQGRNSLAIDSSSTPSFNDVLSEMPYDKLQEFMSLLSLGNQLDYNKIENLYPSVEQSDEANRYRHFFQNYSLKFLDGINAINFKLINKHTKEERIIKLDFRFEAPKDIERKLRKDANPSFLTAIYAERTSTFEHQKRGDLTCNVLETDMIRGKNLRDFAHSSKSPQERVNKSTKIYSQMADAFLTLQMNHVAFTDSKNTNWMIDHQGNIKVIDTKSFIPIKKNGIFVKNEIRARGYDTANSIYVSPPELISNENKSALIKVGPMHSYLLGKNLYQFLTGCLDEELDKTPLNFDDPIFKTLDGKLMKKIIEQATNEDPNKRMTLTAIKQQLRQIDEIRIQKEAAFRKIEERLPIQGKTIDLVYYCQEQIFYLTALEQSTPNHHIKNLIKQSSQLHSLYIEYLENAYGNPEQQQIIVEQFKELADIISFTRTIFDESIQTEKKPTANSEDIQHVTKALDNLIKKSRKNYFDIPIIIENILKTLNGIKDTIFQWLNFSKSPKEKTTLYKKQMHSIVPQPREEQSASEEVQDKNPKLN